MITMVKETVSGYQAKGKKRTASYTREKAEHKVKKVPYHNLKITPSQRTRIERYKKAKAKIVRGDQVTGRELQQFAFTVDEASYARIENMLKLFAKKQKKGVLDKDLARIGMYNVSGDVVKRYNKVNQTNLRFSTQDKIAFVEEVLDEEWDEIKAGKYD